MHPAELKRKVVNRLARASWLGLRDTVDAAREATRIRDLMGLVEALDFSEDDLEANRKLLAAAARLREPIGIVNWFLPYFQYAFYGGIHTILRFAW
ncbi:MAG: hypothetical protein E6J61_19305 [Deltaproteobacteria bacterium]|nr:MAG: hypothetical protein E6J61_19305 [Deltaproteobacteria bacterium]